MNKGIFLGLGSNLGDRLAFLRAAIAGMEAGGCVLLQASGAYETPPWGLLEQPAFLNAVVQIQTELGANDLLRLALQVERSLGRVRSQHWGPRQIDIDLLCCGGEVVVSQALQVPHPYLQDRGFVLVPWAELAPDFRVPCLGRSVGELLAYLPVAAQTEIVRIGDV
jgi:2-amino-4-hydroxy-6-hydroxymethyldihydropteridine diphosphokinase